MYRPLLFACCAIAAPVAFLWDSPVAEACGGCFVVQQSRTVVSGHRMILSVSPEQTTLWDQIVYSGEPESFAWVLPVKGLATVGLSSDALFENLDARTRVQIFSPEVYCTLPSGPSGGLGPCSTASGAGPTGGGGELESQEESVEVVSHQVVGPYETVQLSSADPQALQDWLASHGYTVPADVSPVIEAYVAESFDFLALKLVPGVGVDAMRPVRVSSPGAAATLPLRMVAAGTGAFTPISLWVFGEGRYEPMNFPSFTIDAADLWWDFTSASSNYKELRAAEYAASDDRAWLVESAGEFSAVDLTSTMLALAESDPPGSGYADEQGMGAVEACQADLDDLFAGIDPTSAWFTRLRAELSRAALASDLDLGAAVDQSAVAPQLLVPYDQYTGDPCSTSFADCHTGSAASTGSGGNGSGGSGSRASDSGGCAMGKDTGMTLAAALGLLAAACAAARRKRVPR